MQNSEKQNRKIFIFPTMFLMQSPDDPEKYDTFNIFDGEPVDWQAKMEFALVNGKKASK